MNSFLPTLELFFSLAITLILYLTFRTTIQVTSSQQPKILTKKVETSKKEELKNKPYEKKEDKTIIPSTLPSKEKNRGEQTTTNIECAVDSSHRKNYCKG